MGSYQVRTTPRQQTEDEIREAVFGSDYIEVVDFYGDRKPMVRVEGKTPNGRKVAEFEVDYTVEAEGQVPEPLAALIEDLQAAGFVERQQGKGRTSRNDRVYAVDLWAHKEARPSEWFEDRLDGAKSTRSSRPHARYDDDRRDDDRRSSRRYEDDDRPTRRYARDYDDDRPSRRYAREEEDERPTTRRAMARPAAEEAPLHSRTRVMTKDDITPEIAAMLAKLIEQSKAEKPAESQKPTVKFSTLPEAVDGLSLAKTLGEFSMGVKIGIDNELLVLQATEIMNAVGRYNMAHDEAYPVEILDEAGVLKMLNIEHAPEKPEAQPAPAPKRAKKA